MGKIPNSHHNLRKIKEKNNLGPGGFFFQTYKTEF